MQRGGAKTTMNDQDPKVIYTPEAVNLPKKKWFKAKMIFLPLIVIIAAEVVFGIKTLMTPVPVKEVAAPVAIGRAKLLLTTPQSSYKTGDIIPVSIQLTTAGYTSAGTDLILNYDPKILEASVGSFTKGSVYQDYPYISFDAKKGIISVSGAASVSEKGFKGTGVFGTVNFKAKAKGKAVLTIDFEADSINKTNVIDVDSNQNILDPVSALELDIK